MESLLASLLLFPSFEHHRLYVGPYGHTVAADQINVLEAPLWRLDGLELGWRHLREEPLSDFLLDDADDWSPVGAEAPISARFFIAPDGTVQIDRLVAETAFFGIRSRPLLGDSLDISILGGQQETTAAALDTGRAQLRLVIPAELTLLGFSNTDFDPDRRLKYYLSAGAGAGGEVLAKVLGPIGLYGRAVGFARTLNRHQRDAPNQVRHELSGDLELGLALIGQRQALWLSGWSELVSQWETRDLDGKSGIDRQYGAWGIRLNGRFHPADSGSHTPTQRKPDGEGPVIL